MDWGEKVSASILWSVGNMCLYRTVKQVSCVQDAGSLNGTFVDDGDGRRRLMPDETATLKQGDRIWIADQILVVGLQEDG